MEEPSTHANGRLESEYAVSLDRMSLPGAMDDGGLSQLVPVRSNVA
jgi:hypothetical protein